jgi:peptidoglycan/xylan/chitin deacetylase (PgdA/CDA1 family)
MSDQPIEQPLKQRRRTFVLILCRMVILILMFGPILLSPAVHGEEISTSNVQSLPLLVRARQGDTPASLARRYLNDAAKGWMIAEYNGMVSFPDGQAVIVPTAPFRLGGLTPAGYQIVPVLAYTAIGESSGRKTQVSRVAFEEQMSWLKNGGYAAIAPSQLIDFMEFSCQLPRQAVLITADTESLTFFNRVVPILNAFGFTATLCVATERVGKSGNMTWDQLQQLHAAGFSIGCRGRHGRSLTRRPSGQSLENYFNTIEADLRQAKKTVERHLGTACTVLAYPHGHSNDLVAATAAKLGFSAAFVQSTGENPFFGSRFGIHRLVIDSRVGPGQFTEMLTTMVAVDLH